MLAGGTGITPMIQALHALLGADENAPKITLLYGCQQEDDILARDLLEGWAETYADRFQFVPILSDDDQWDGPKGYIDQDKLDTYLPSAATSNNDEDVIVLVCGPPAMYASLCGPREEPETVSGILGSLGYSASQVYKF